MEPSLRTPDPAPRLVWITNLSAPYRRPMWAALSRRFVLSVGLLAKTERNRRWSADLPGAVSQHRLMAWTLRANAEPLYVVRGRGLRGFGRGDAVVLPGWEHPAAWQLLIEARIRRVATVAFYESNRQSQRFGRGPIARVRTWFFRHVDVVLTVGQASRSAVLESGVDASRVVMTHNSIDTETFATASASHVDSEIAARRFTYVGQLIERKNVESLLRALTLCDDGYELDIIGEGPLDQRLRGLADELGLAGRVHFHGYLEPKAVAQRLRKAGTLVLPSTTEVYGLAPVEALALGRHVVLSTCAGVTADISDMPGVWSAEPDPVRLADAMRSSCAAWDGPVENPCVLEWTPERFAEDTARAVEIAISHRVNVAR